MPQSHCSSQVATTKLQQKSYSSGDVLAFQASIRRQVSQDCSTRLLWFNQLLCSTHFCTAQRRRTSLPSPRDLSTSNEDQFLSKGRILAHPQKRNGSTTTPSNATKSL